MSRRGRTRSKSAIAVGSRPTTHSGNFPVVVTGPGTVRHMTTHTLTTTAALLGLSPADLTVLIDAEIVEITNGQRVPEWVVEELLESPGYVKQALDQLSLPQTRRE